MNQIKGLAGVPQASFVEGKGKGEMEEWNGQGMERKGRKRGRKGSLQAVLREGKEIKGFSIKRVGR